MKPGLSSQKFDLIGSILCSSISYHCGKGFLVLLGRAYFQSHNAHIIGGKDALLWDWSLSLFLIGFRTEPEFEHSACGEIFQNMRPADS